MRRRLFLLLIGKKCLLLWGAFVFKYSGVHHETKTATGYKPSMLKTRHTSQQQESKETSETVSTLASWSRHISTLLHRFCDGCQHFLACWLQLSVKLNLVKFLCNALIQFMVACKCALLSSAPKWWSVSEFKSFRSDRRRKLTAETSVKAAVQLLKLKSQTITELCSH